MNFIEFEEMYREQEFIMPTPHSHEHYELYFLLDGECDFFVKNKMFVVSKNTLVIIPPFIMHKTEGKQYKRINVNVSPDLLTNNQIDFLQKAAEKITLKLSNEHISTINSLLKTGANFPINSKIRNESLTAFTQTILTLLSLQEHISTEVASTTKNLSNVSAEVLKIIYYINRNYTKQLTLKELCNEFFICKVSLCKKFKDVMNCSIMEYVLQLRLNKAKALLQSGNKSIEDIAEQCGFSSANYFGLIFKKNMGISPLNYKKTR